MKHERISETLSGIAGDKRIGIAALKRLSSQQLFSLKDMIQEVLPLALEAEKLVAAKEAEKIKAANEIAKLIQDSGFTLDQIKQYSSSQKRPSSRPKVPVKYRAQVDGQELSWTGRGKMPTGFRALLDQGRNLSEFEVN